MGVIQRWIGVLAAGGIAWACSSGGTSRGAPEGGLGGSCASAQSCTGFAQCPELSCKCPGSKFQATIRRCVGGCCATNCDEACGTSSGGTGGSGGGSGGSGGSGNASGSGGAATGGAAGSGGTVNLQDGGTTSQQDIHVLFYDQKAPSGSYYGVLHHAVKAAGTSSFVIDDVDQQFSDSPSSSYALAEMVLDAAGNPQVAYSHGRTKELRFRRWDGAAWVKMDGTAGYDVLDTGVDWTGVAKHFLVMHQGKPELAFRQSTNLKRYSWDGSAWQGTVILELYPPTGGSNPGGAPALAFDSQGYAHIAHHDHKQYHLNYVHDGPSGWINELIAISPELSGQYKFIALDSADRPHIAFRHGYTRWNGSAWVKADGSPGYDAFDANFIRTGQAPNGDVLMGHVANGHVELLTKSLSATSWTDLGGVYPDKAAGAFAADASGTIHAVLVTDELLHLEQTSTGWLAEPIGATGNHPSIELY